jgi:hypothetical protein
MKKHIITLSLIAAVVLPHTLRGAELVALKTMPADTQQFVYQRNAMAGSPEGGAAVFVTALILYMGNKNIGMECLTIALDQTRLAEGATYKGFTPDKAAAEAFASLSQKSRSYIPFSYIVGTSPDRDYKAVLPWSYEFVDSSRSFRTSDEATLLIKSTGDQIPRAIKMKKNDRNIWKVVEFGELMKDVKQPVRQKTDDL